MQLLLARGRARAHGQGHGKHTSEMAAACGERGVPSLQHRRHGAEWVYGMFSGTLDIHATALNGGRAHITQIGTIKPKKCDAASRSAKIKSSQNVV